LVGHRKFQQTRKSCPTLSINFYRKTIAAGSTCVKLTVLTSPYYHITILPFHHITMLSQTCPIFLYGTKAFLQQKLSSQNWPLSHPQAQNPEIEAVPALTSSRPPNIIITAQEPLMISGRTKASECNQRSTRATFPPRTQWKPTMTEATNLYAVKRSHCM